MPLRILLLTATSAEAEALTKIRGISNSKEGFVCGNCEIELLVTGVGTISTAWALTKWFCLNPGPDLALNAGIAGSYKTEFAPGAVIVPVSDCFADSGIETAGGFKTLFDAGFEDPGRFPFSDGKIKSENRFVSQAVRELPAVNAITVSTATGSKESIDRLVLKFNPDIETMEGAAFFYICRRENVPFLAIRSVSNMVEPRDRSKWNIQLALDNLSEKLGDLLLMFD